MKCVRLACAYQAKPDRPYCCPECERLDKDDPFITISEFFVFPDEGISLKYLVRAVERHATQVALNRVDGDRERAAKLLRIERPTLAVKMKMLGFELSSSSKRRGNR
jgi:DNA-binding NtrC family response regulator